MSRDLKSKFDVERYKPLGLLANPFTISGSSEQFLASDVETYAEANALLQAIMKASDEASPKPIVVTKAGSLPSGYYMRAAGLTQRYLASDDGVNVLFSYVLLFLMRIGRVRAIIQMLAERLVFRDFDRTIMLHIQHVIAERDDDLVAFQLLGEEKFQAFAQRFAADPAGTTTDLFGTEEIERHPELAQLADTRVDDLPSDVEDEDALPEIDSTIADAPGNAILMSEEAEADTNAEDDDQLLVDYIIEHTKVHISPVIARALRVYRERGQVAAVAELKVTKAPKKTMAAIIKFSQVRFKKAALIFDGFDGWFGVPQEMKVQIASTLSEVRWQLADDAVLVLLLEEGKVPELEEQFGNGTRLTWAFPSLRSYEENPDALDREALEGWLDRSEYPGKNGVKLGDPVLAKIFETSDGFQDFMRRAGSAIENAADRGVSALDDEALAEAMVATSEAENE